MVALSVLVNEDDGTIADAVRAWLGEASLDPKWVFSDVGNQGYSGGHNRLLAELFSAGTLAIDGVLVLNPDVVAEPGLVSAVTDFAASRCDPMLVGPLLELADADTLAGEGVIDTCGTVWDRWARHHDLAQGRPIAEAPTAPQKTAGISGACIYVPRAAYERVIDATGEFFDADFIAYREDAELGIRAALVGVESWVVPAARGRHVRRLRGTSRGVSAHIDRLSVRNRFLMRFKLGTYRPGGRLAATFRDVAVVAGVLLREPRSLSGLLDAVRLRGAMRRKHARLCLAERVNA